MDFISYFRGPYLKFSLYMTYTLAKLRNDGIDIKISTEVEN